jgi:hypothetical protein
MTDNAQAELREQINQLWDKPTTEGHVQSCGEYQHTVDETMHLFTDWHTHKLNEAIREEWALISEVAHSANITAELFIGKAREDRLAELDTINAGDEQRKHTINAGA